jgi:hypothetical protein
MRRKKDDRYSKQHNMHPTLPRTSHDPDCVRISACQKYLKEKHRSGPHRWRPTKPRQNKSADHRLDLE